MATFKRALQNITNYGQTLEVTYMVAGRRVIIVVTRGSVDAYIDGTTVAITVVPPMHVTSAAAGWDRRFGNVLPDARRAEDEALAQVISYLSLPIAAQRRNTAIGTVAGVAGVGVAAILAYLMVIHLIQVMTIIFGAVGPLLLLLIILLLIIRR